MRTLVVLVVAVGTIGVLAPSGTPTAAAPEPPPVTVNEFFPADRPIGDCISALPKPGCGSEARGGPHQAAVFGALVLGLGVIGTRIVVGVRRRDDAVSPQR